MGKDTVAADSTVLEAFLHKTSHRAGEVHSDGEHLYSGNVAIAKWKGGVLWIVPSVGSNIEEAYKDHLVDYILRKIQREELLWSLVQPKAQALHPEATTAP